MTPSSPPSTLAKSVAAGLMLVSLIALALAPSLMPESYSWVRQTTSESAAQGVPGAWLARLGFLLLGLAVTWMAATFELGWSFPARVMHGAFGLLMVATAAFSTRSWLPNTPYDPVEDALHSFTATAMGFAFAIGVFLVLLQRRRDPLGRGLDLVSVCAAVAIPIGMSTLPNWDGLLQRAMFAIAYVWYAAELLRKRS